MADEKRDQKPGDEAPTDLSRREFVTMSVAAGIVAAAGAASGAEMPTVEKSVQVKTADGVADEEG